MNFEELMNGRRQQEDNSPMSETVAKGQIATLREFHRSLNMNEQFKRGDIVTWKDGLSNKLSPKIGQYVIVEEVLEDIIIDKESTAGTYYFREQLDIKIGILDGGDYNVMHVDSRRFKKVK